MTKNELTKAFEKGYPALRKYLIEWIEEFNKGKKTGDSYKIDEGISYEDHKEFIIYSPYKDEYLVIQHIGNQIGGYTMVTPLPVIGYRKNEPDSLSKWLDIDDIKKSVNVVLDFFDKSRWV